MGGISLSTGDLGHSDWWFGPFFMISSLWGVPPDGEKVEKRQKTPLYESAHFLIFFEKSQKNRKKREIPSCPKYGGPAGYRQSQSKSGKISNEKIHLLKAPQTTSREPVIREFGWRLFFHFFGVSHPPADGCFSLIHQ
jgi:hypothetical protein